jgi:hypothetical protein
MPPRGIGDDFWSQLMAERDDPLQGNVVGPFEENAKSLVA